MKQKMAVVALVFLCIGVLSACGNKKHQYAQCVDRNNNIADPAQCQQLQTQAVSHQGDSSWMNQYLLYQWAFGGNRQGNQFIGAQTVPVYQSLPKNYLAVPQDDYVRQTSRATGVTPTTVARPSSAALKAAQKQSAPASKPQTTTKPAAPAGGTVGTSKPTSSGSGSTSKSSTGSSSSKSSSSGSSSKSSGSGSSGASSSSGRSSGGATSSSGRSK